MMTITSIMAEQGHSNEQKRPYDDVEYGQYDNDADYLTPIYDEGVAPLLPKHTVSWALQNSSGTCCVACYY